MLELPAQAEVASRRPVLSRSSTFEGPVQLRQDPFYGSSPARSPQPQSASLSRGSRPDYSNTSGGYFSYSPDASAEPEPFSDEYTQDSSNNLSASYGSPPSASTSATNLNSPLTNKKGPPPPPPSRAKKPPPPPPPVKRPSTNGLYTVG